MCSIGVCKSIYAFTDSSADAMSNTDVTGLIVYHVRGSREDEHDAARNEPHPPSHPDDVGVHDANTDITSLISYIFVEIRPIEVEGSSADPHSNFDGSYLDEYRSKSDKLGTVEKRRPTAFQRCQDRPLSIDIRRDTAGNSSDPSAQFTWQTQ